MRTLGSYYVLEGQKKDLKPGLWNLKLQTTFVFYRTIEAREQKVGRFGGRAEERLAVGGANRAKGNRCTYPYPHKFLSRSWRKRIGEYVSMGPEHTHTTQEAY